MRYGAIGLLSGIEHIELDPKLERLCVLVKEAYPHENGSYTLRLAKALKIPGASLEKIRRVQRSYGYGQRQDSNDVKYYKEFQKILESIEYYKKTKKYSGHNIKERSKTFLSFSHDSFQQKIELFKELSQTQKRRKIRPIVQKYGISPKRFYELQHRYMFYGIWGLVDLIHISRRVGEKISSELELKIIEERLMNPMLSVTAMIRELNLKCSDSNVQKIYKRWSLSEFKTAVPMRGIIPSSIPDKAEIPIFQNRSAVSNFPRLIQESNLKINRGFSDLVKHLRYKSIPICNPGAIIIAPFLHQLGIVEAIHTYGPETNRTTEITNNILINVLRIIVGFPTINDFTQSLDPSIAIGAGLSLIPRKSRFYETFDELRFCHLQKLRNDAACRAKELGIIEAKEVAIDYHSDKSDSRYHYEKRFSQAPDKNGDIVYAHRPQILWDSGTNSIINIAYCEGRSRAQTALYNFLEENLFKVIDPSTLEEIYADSEYTGEKQIIYLIVRSHTEVTMCLKQNPKIRRWKEETIKEADWQPYSEQYRIASRDYILPETGKLFRFVVKQHIETNEIRCFGSTHIDFSPKRILDAYRIRWPVETGIRDLIENYFLNKPPGTSPEKAEVHYYCIMLARLVVDYFLSICCDPKWKKPEDWQCVLSTLRTSVFSSQSCELSLHDSGDLLITYLVGDRGFVKAHLKTVLDKRRKAGLNVVPWWANRAVRIEIKDKYNFFKNGSQ